MPEISRRRFLAAAGLMPLAAAMPRRVLARVLSSSGAWRFFGEHQAAVVREATARLIPGPSDDPAELGHPGAREANVVRYIDTLLGAFTEGGTPPIFAGGPFSDRSGADQDDMARFVPLSAMQETVWRARVERLQQTYREGVELYDARAGGDFAAAPAPVQDRVLSGDDTGFRDVLFTHAIEGMYAVPEYGGNEGLVGWMDIRFPGDVQPRGYTAAEVSQSDGIDPVATALLPVVLQNFDEFARALAARWRRG